MKSKWSIGDWCTYGVERALAYVFLPIVFCVEMLHFSFRTYLKNHGLDLMHILGSAARAAASTAAVALMAIVICVCIVRPCVACIEKKAYYRFRRKRA